MLDNPKLRDSARPGWGAEMGTLQEAGWLGWAQVVLALGGVIWALVAAVLLGMKWKVPPFLAVAPLFAQGLVLAVAGLRADSLIHAPFAPEVLFSGLTLAVASVIANRMLVISVLPTALVLLLGGAMAGVQGRRGWGAPVATALAALGTAVVPLVGIADHVPVPLAAIRFGLYGVAAIPLIAALTGAHPQNNSREGGLVAAAAFAAIVAAGEALVVGHLWSQSFRSLAVVAPDAKDAVIAKIIEELRGEGTLAGVALALASIPAVVALLRPPAELTEEEILSGSTSPSTGRWLAGALALLVPLVWGAAFVCTDAATLMTQVQLAVGR